MDRNARIRAVTEAEWGQFQRVKNEGGRAACQDDRLTFDRMRNSQFMAWTDDVLSSYLEDLRQAEAAGWNLVMEKYLRMMESTAPESYARLKSCLPERSSLRHRQTEELLQSLLRQAEAFASSFPGLASRGRSLHTREDGPWDTSYETYARGELLTYSDQTFCLFLDMEQLYRQAGISLFRLVMENQAELWGYGSLAEAEADISGSYSRSPVSLYRL